MKRKNLKILNNGINHIYIKLDYIKQKKEIIKLINYNLKGC